MENITADGVDINNFLERRIQEHREPIEADLMKDIVGTIGNAEGMYRPLN
jgi:hypothetical protein